MRFLYPISFFSASLGLLTVPASTATERGKKLLPTLPQNVAGKGDDTKAKNTVGKNIIGQETPQTGNQNDSSNAATGVHQQEKGQDL